MINSNEVMPLITFEGRVPSEWLDYNGHMNVSYYSMAFDQGIDEIFEEILGIGATYTKSARMGPYVLQNNLHYLDELLEGANFSVQLTLLDHDAKRMHVFLEMFNESGGLAATSEQLLMNVDLTTRRSAPYPDAVLTLLSELQAGHDRLTKSKHIGAPLGIRRKG